MTMKLLIEEKKITEYLLRNGYEITYNGLLVLLPFNFLEKVLK
jgi:hypothetical protein